MSSECPVKHEAKPAECPVKHDQPQLEIDPNNNMPKIPEMQTWPGQKQDLNKTRATSTIPKGAFTPPHQENVKEGEAWVYPSEQQFFNAMKRKGFDAKEEDMVTVVAIHNAVNERTWREVLKWETRYHAQHCPEPRLLKFLGRPTDKSPKARFLTTFLGYVEPFDRHDWTVDRCGEEVRYVVDFYRGKISANDGTPIAFHVDARPALDNFSAVKDRVRMCVSEWFGF
ncbi:hypothetical protein BASA81_001231 [Batrachochytrium salamandrivorans]|nr:hypothetical protein BASA81_001231 [Batrachochytrium salamandrivorans]